MAFGQPTNAPTRIIINLQVENSIFVIKKIYGLTGNTAKTSFRNSNAARDFKTPYGNEIVRNVREAETRWKPIFENPYPIVGVVVLRSIYGTEKYRVFGNVA